MQTYRTSDIQIASYLIASGFEQYFVTKERNVVYFTFESDESEIPDNVFQLEVDQYYANNSLIPPKKLFNAYRELKARISEVLYQK